MPFEHETVKHSIREYVNGMAHTNGIESFWALLKRGYHVRWSHFVGQFQHRKHQGLVVGDAHFASPYCLANPTSVMFSAMPSCGINT